MLVDGTGSWRGSLMAKESMVRHSMHASFVAPSCSHLELELAQVLLLPPPGSPR